MESMPEAPNSIIINRETGAAKRLGQKAPVTPHLQKLIDQTVSNGYVPTPLPTTKSKKRKQSYNVLRLARRPALPSLEAETSSKG
ncbi:hypothetical protein FNYG_14305 [Fusarium nygamai]|uniref:Uncharacterized protein n=1 Tax=Gibberella nygamai TaxID=42673 RepID=A0A2K0UT71_GIBNY|nr:hypothetical protein FNYG_14305 [Fusarium nygamai]